MNGSMLDDKPTGVGVYSFNLINHLSTLSVNSNVNTISVFTPTSLNLNKHVNIIKIPELLQSSRHGKLAALCRFCWNTFFYPMQARKFDLLISPTTHGSFLLSKQIITIHDLLSLRYKNISSHQRFYFKYILPFLINRAQLIIAVSENTKKDIIHFFKCPEEKIKVIHNGYDNDLYFPGTEKDDLIYREYGVKNYFLSIGPTYPHKNFEKLINAWNNLSEPIKQEHPLVIAGGKEKYIKTLTLLVKKLGIENKVFFLGYVPIKFMPMLYREATALVFPSLYEGFGIPLLEGMACGCPVLASNTSSIPEVCGDAVLYFNPDDQASITTSMCTVLSSSQIRIALAEKGLIQANKFSWKKMAESFNTEIENYFNKN